MKNLKLKSYVDLMKEIGTELDSILIIRECVGGEVYSWKVAHEK